MIKTLITWAAVLAIALTAVWYFLLKKHDYSISFKINETPGEVYQQLIYYNYGKVQDVKNVEKNPFDRIIQNVKLDSSDFLLSWNLKIMTDSTTQVTANIKNETNPFLSRMKLLFGQEDYKEIFKEEVRNFQVALNEEALLYDVTVEGIITSPATTCACIGFENEVKNKAQDMMKNIEHLSKYIRDNELEMEARPRVNVLNWNTENNHIKFEFCFPIAPENLPRETDRIYLKHIPARESLMAIYNGNYMYSHLAWVKLLNYAELMDIEVLKEPQEVFNNNPEMGGDSRLWEAEIYLPLNSN